MAPTTKRRTSTSPRLRLPPPPFLLLIPALLSASRARAHAHLAPLPRSDASFLLPPPPPAVRSNGASSSSSPPPPPPFRTAPRRRATRSTSPRRGAAAAAPPPPPSDGANYARPPPPAPTFDPIGASPDGSWDAPSPRSRGGVSSSSSSSSSSSPSLSSRLAAPPPAAPLAVVAVLSLPRDAAAAYFPDGDYSRRTVDLSPENFRPVCPTSDSFYRLLSATAESAVGPDAAAEYRPLIAGGLLRVRLELCVVESFFNEAVGPFVRERGLSWVLPLHETPETFLAGTVFALASTFILVGSTKIVAVMAVYGDALVGAPCRLLGGFLFDRARGRPVTLDVGVGPWKTRVVGPPEEDVEEVRWDDVPAGKVPVIAISGAVKYVGEGSRIFREVIESIDSFVGKYLVLAATGYIGIKFLHFKVFPDFPPTF